MITKEQIDEHCKSVLSKLLWATLDRDYQARHLDYVLPAGTIVQIELYRISLGDLYLNGELVDADLPYDAATLLETEE